MGWRKIGKPRVVRVTGKLAREWYEMQAAPGDRQLSPRRVAAYHKACDNGTFRSTDWAVVTCLANGEQCRCNGKHTALTFWERAEQGKLDEQYVTIHEFEADTPEDVARLYGTYDSRIQSRNTGDINRSYHATIPELADVSSSAINLVVTALACTEWAEDLYARSPGKTAAERAELLFDNIPFALWFAETFSKTKRNAPFLRGPVVAAMLLTWRKSHAAATEFWTAARDENRAPNSLPDRRLADWLKRTSVSGDGASTGKLKDGLADTREMFARCISAWNLWRADRNGDIRYYPMPVPLPRPK